MGMIVLMGLFGHLYLYGIHPEVWIAAPAMTETLGIALVLILAIVAAWLSRRVLAMTKRGEFAGQGPWLLGLLGAMLLGAASWWDVVGWGGAGLDPAASGQGATVFVLIAFQGFTVAIAAIMAVYLGYRSGKGLLTTPTNVTLDIVTRFIGYTALQGLAIVLLTRLYPGV